MTKEQIEGLRQQFARGTGVAMLVGCVPRLLDEREALLDALVEMLEEVAPSGFVEPCLLCGDRGEDCCHEATLARAAIAKAEAP